MAPLYFAGCDPDLHTLSIVYLHATGAAGTVGIERILLLKARGTAKEQAVLDMLARLPVCASLASPPLTAFAVESQNSSYTGRTNAARVSDLLCLAQVAGGATLWIQQASAPRSLQLLVKPSAWKGSVPKGIHQCRVLKKLGIPFSMAGGKEPYPVPEGLDSLVSGDKVNKGDWKDINDSIGLAVYAWEMWKIRAHTMIKFSC